VSRAALLLIASAALAGCYDFDKLLRDCADGGSCPGADGGTGGGSGGGAATGGGSATGGGTATGGGGASCADAFDGGHALTGICYQNVCWENPLPTGETLSSVVGSSRCDVWAAGGADLLLHWNGCTWQNAQLSSIGAYQDEAISGLGWSGSRWWSTLTNGPVETLGTGGWSDATSGISKACCVSARSFDAGEESIWIAEPYGPLHRWAGTGFESVVLNGTDHVVALGADSRGGVWTAGDDGTNPLLRHFEAGTMSGQRVMLQGGLTDQLASASVLADDSAVYVDYNFRLGQAWLDGGSTGFTLMNAPTSSSRGLGFAPTGEGFVVGDAFTVYVCSTPSVAGCQPTTVVPSYAPDVIAAWASPGLEGSWLVGRGGTLARYTDGGFAFYNQGLQANVHALVVEPDGGILAAVDYPGVLQRTDGGWSLSSFIANESVRSWSVSPNGARLCGGGNGHLKCTGPAAVDDTSFGSGYYNGVAALDDGGVAVASELGQLGLWANHAWSTLVADAGAPLNAVAVSATGDIWAVGDKGVVIHMTPAGGLDPSNPTTGLGSFYAVWIDPNTQLPLIAGDDGSHALVLRPDAGGWENLYDVGDEFSQSAYGLAGAGVDDLYTVGPYGALHHRDAATWTRIETGTRVSLHTLLLHGPDVWLAGDVGAILHFQR